MRQHEGERGQALADTTQFRHQSHTLPTVRLHMHARTHPLILCTHPRTHTPMHARTHTHTSGISTARSMLNCLRKCVFNNQLPTTLTEEGGAKEKRPFEKLVSKERG